MTNKRTKGRGAPRTARAARTERRHSREMIAQEVSQNSIWLREGLPETVPRAEAHVVCDQHIVPLVSLSRHGVVHSVNEAALDFLGCQAHEIVLRPFSNLLSPSDTARFFKFLGQGASQGRLQGDFVVRTARELVPVHVVLQADGKSEAVRPFFRIGLMDLRQAPASEEWLSEWGRDYRDLLNAVDGIVWKANYPMRFTFVSEQAERILGYKPIEWVRNSEFWEQNMFYEDRERVTRARELAIRSGKPHVIEYRMLSATRKIVWVRDSATVTRNANGKVTLAGIMSDITALRDAQERLLQNQAQLEEAVRERTARLEDNVRSMELFCYGMAHDLKAPLRAMSAYSDLLADDYGQRLDETGRDYVARIGRAARHFGSLVEALLRYGRLSHEPVKSQPVDLCRACTRASDLLRDEINERRAKLHVHCARLCAWADPTLVEEILMNLIGNALKFARPNVRPQISVDARGAEGRSGKAVRVSVTDNGIGIKDEDTRKIFEVFQRLRPHSDVPGTGIGLALVKRAAELMNGRVGVYSLPNEGSTFWFELPAAPRAQRSAQQPRLSS